MRILWASVLMAMLGCSGDESGGKSLAALQPATAFLGRQLTVHIGGDGTHFAAGATQVDFGDANLQVAGVTVGSPTLLLVDVRIGPADPAAPMTYARLGPHDVVVTTGEEQVALKGVFSVLAPVAVAPLAADDQPGGKLVQGGLSRFAVTNLDYVQEPFGDVHAPQFTLGFPGDGLAVALSGSASRLVARSFIDVKAGSDPAFFAVGPAPLGGTVAYPLPAGTPMQSPRIEPRAPLALPLGQATMDKLLFRDDTALYRITPSTGLMGSDRLYSFTFTRAMNARIRPILSLLPPSGKWSEQLAAGGGLQLMGAAGIPYFAVVARDTAELYAVVYDAQLGGGEGYDYGLTVKEQAASVISGAMYMAGTRPDMPNRQVDLQRPVFFKTPRLAGHADKNYFEFAVAADSKLFVVTAASDPTKDTTDIMLDVLGGPCRSGRSIFGGPVDDTAFDAVSFDAKAGMILCVVISDSTYPPPYYNQMGGPYTLLITTNN